MDGELAKTYCLLETILQEGRLLRMISVCYVPGVSNQGSMCYGNVGVEQDIWVGSLVKLQRYTLGQHDVVQLFQELLSRLHTTEFELFLVQAWLIWNQRIVMNHRRKLKDPKWLNKRAADYLDDFRQAQDLLQILETNMGTRVWQPPPNSMFELELCCCYFSRLKLLRCGCNGPQQEG